jgi:DNA replication initiation complex subunit (GINS family)
MQKYLKIAIFSLIKMSDFNITYEFLFEIMRSEKNSSELQKLPDNFYELVVEYIKEKQDLLKKDDDLFSANEKKQVLTLLENLEKILTEIYNRREKKIIDLAIVKSKTKSGLIDTTNMLKYEVLFFEKVLITFDNFRNNLLTSALSARPIDMEFMSDNAKTNQKSIITVRFLEDISKFVDEDMKYHGPFEKETIATLPLSVARILEEQNKLEILDDM